MKELNVLDHLWLLTFFLPILILIEKQKKDVIVIKDLCSVMAIPYSTFSNFL